MNSIDDDEQYKIYNVIIQYLVKPKDAKETSEEDDFYHPYLRETCEVNLVARTEAEAAGRAFLENINLDLKTYLKPVVGFEIKEYELPVPRIEKQNYDFAVQKKVTNESTPQ